MLDQWLLVHDHYLPIHLSHIFNVLREVICLKVLKRVCMQLLMWIHQNIQLTIGGTDYHSEIPETDKVSTYTGLDDYDALFAARHGRGALDPVPRVSDQMIMMTSLGIPPPVTGPELVNPMERVMPARDIVHSSQREQVSLPKDTLQPCVVSPSSEIIGEGAAIFTDMTETILNVLDKQVAMSPDAQQTKRLSLGDNQIKRTQGKEPKTSLQKEGYPDLFLPVVENYRISDWFLWILRQLVH